MLEDAIEERLDGLEKKVEELSNELHELKRERIDSPALTPGAEYDFVPSLPDRVIARGVAKIVRVGPAPNDLGLSPREWELYSIPEEVND